jgi:hypothetical protein
MIAKIFQKEMHMPGWKTFAIGTGTALSVYGAGALLSVFGATRLDSILQQKLHSIITNVLNATLTTPTVQLAITTPNASIPVDLEFFIPEFNRTITASLKILIPQSIHIPLQINSVSLSIISLTNASLKSALASADNASNTVATLAMLMLLFLLALLVNSFIIDKFIMLGGTKLLHTDIKQLNPEHRALNAS